MATTSRLLLLFALFWALWAPAQELRTLPRNAAREQAWLDAISARCNLDVESASGPNKKIIAEVYRERSKLIRDCFTEGEILTDTGATEYLNALAAEIFRANPQLNAADLRIVFSRSAVANASSMGEGTVFFNIGLFHRLSDESQAAFALCHELAHYYLNHGNRNIEGLVNTLLSEEYQKKLREVQKSKYRQNQQLDEIERSFTFRNRRHSRASEAAADSLALLFLQGTGFDLQGALGCLALLDTAEKDKYDAPVELDRRFSFTAFPFKKEWTESDALAFTARPERDEALADSLKTHPDCSLRIAKLRPWVEANNSGPRKKFLVSEARFHELQQQFDYEILSYYFEFNVSRCLFLTLEMLHDQPANAYLHGLVGYCLNELYARQKIHELGKVANLPSPDFPEEYNRLLHLIQNIRLGELAGLSYYYLHEKEESCGKDPLFAAALRKATENYIH